MDLIIETSTERGLVALAEDGVIIVKEELPFGYHNSKNLMPIIDSILGEKKPKAIIVGVGPGSYTGIRIGAVTAKTFSFAWNIPIFAVSTLVAFCTTDAAAILDAKISGAYVLLPSGVPKICPLKDLGSVLGNISTLITPNLPRLKEKVEALYPCKWKWEERPPNPLLMLKSVNRDLPLKHDQMELLYLRETLGGA